MTETLQRIDTLKTSPSEAASLISVVDSGSYYDSANVEGALQELGPAVGGARLVFSTVLLADAATIDTGVGAIPVGNILRIFAVLRTDEAATQSTATVRFNNDSSANYDRPIFEVSNTTLSGTTGIGQTGIQVLVAGGNATANVFSPVRLELPGFALAVGNVCGVLVAGVPAQVAATSDARIGCFEWRSLVPPNRVTLAITTGSGQKFKAGSALYVEVS